MITMVTIQFTARERLIALAAVDSFITDFERMPATFSHWADDAERLYNRLNAGNNVTMNSSRMLETLLRALENAYSNELSNAVSEDIETDEQFLGKLSEILSLRKQVWKEIRKMEGDE